jgi:hypothetical protein
MRYLLLLVLSCFSAHFSWAALKQEENLEELTINFASNFSYTYQGSQLRSLCEHCKLFEKIKSKTHKIEMPNVTFHAFNQFLLHLNAHSGITSQTTSKDLAKQLSICINLKAEEFGASILAIFEKRLTTDAALTYFCESGKISDQALAKIFQSNEPSEKNLPIPEKLIANTILKNQVMKEITPLLPMSKKVVSFPSISDITYNAQGSQLAIATDREIHVLNPDNHQLMHNPLCGHNDKITMLSFNPKNEHELASSSHDSTVRLWDTLNEKECFVFKKHKARVNTVFYAQGTGQLISGDEKGNLFIWSPDKEQPEIAYTDPNFFNIRVATYDPAAEKIIYGNLDGFKVLKRIDGTLNLESKIGADISNLPDLCFAAKMLLTYRPADNNFSFKNECTEKYHEHHPYVELKQEAHAEKGGTITIFDKHRIISPLILEPHTEEIKKIVYHPSGNHLVSFDKKGVELVSFDLTKFNELYKIKIGTNLPQALVLVSALKKKLDPNKMPQPLESTAAPLKNILALITEMKQETKTAH